MQDRHTTAAAAGATAVVFYAAKSRHDRGIGGFNTCDGPAMSISIKYILEQTYRNPSFLQ